MKKAEFFPFVAVASIALLVFEFNNLNKSNGDKPEVEKLIPGLPNARRVWIAEYGNPSEKYSDDLQDERSKWVIKADLEAFRVASLAAVKEQNKLYKEL